MSNTVSQQRVVYGRLWWVALLIAVVAAALNTAIFLVGSAQGAYPDTLKIPPAGVPITLGPVVFTSIMGAIAGSIVFAVLGRFSKTPARLFQIIGIVVLVLSMGAPLNIAGAPTGLVMGLELMHVVAGVLTIWGLTRFAIS